MWSFSKLIAGFFVMHRAIRAVPLLFSSASTTSPRLKVYVFLKIVNIISACAKIFAFFSRYASLCRPPDNSFRTSACSIFHHFINLLSVKAFIKMSIVNGHFNKLTISKNIVLTDQGYQKSSECSVYWYSNKEKQTFFRP